MINRKNPGSFDSGLFSGKSEIRTRDRIKSYTSLAGTRLRPTRPSSHLGDTNFNKISVFFQGVTGKIIVFPRKKAYFLHGGASHTGQAPKNFYIL